MAKGKCPQTEPKAERVKLETDLVRPLQDCAVMIRTHLSVVYCITNACTVCVCCIDSDDHLFLVCAFVFVSAIIDYNSYSFGECAICITYMYQTELAKKCISSACLYMSVCIVHWLISHVCICNESKLLVQTRVLLATCTDVESKHWLL